MIFENVVFAGGGNRCFWQAGFWLTVRDYLDADPKHIASVSAGSAISCALFSHKFEEVYENTLKVMTDNKKNRYWNNLLNSEPIHPHNKLYRHIIETSLDEESLKVLHKGPKNHILVAHIPSWLGPKTATLIGISAYQLEKKLFHPVHPKFGRALGFKSEFIAAQECKTLTELTDLIISSSCTPPFTPLMYQSGKAVLDGGMIDNIPVHGVNNFPGHTLVLCSRPYKNLPTIDGRTYIAPSNPVAVNSWDYTNPEAIKITFNQGKEDALLFLDTIKN
jgi:predicted acylesterase/phospholipase RssA